MWQIGSNSGFASGGVIDNVTASPPYGISQTFATITPTFTSTSLTALSCGGTCGASYNATYATGIVNDPHKVCTTLPAFTVAITSGAISGFTITNAGNCSSAPDFLVMNQQNIAVGMQLYVSDSVISNVEANNGIIGAELYGGNNAILHLHPTSVQTCFAINNVGNGSFNGLEPDTCGTAAVKFVTNQATVVSGLSSFGAGGPHLPGTATFQFTSTSNNVNIMGVGALCPVACSTDYQEFIGPSGVLVPGGTGWPAGATVLGNDPVNGNGNYIATLGIGALTVNSCSGPGCGSGSTTPNTQFGVCVGTFTSSVSNGTLQSLGAGSSGVCSGTTTGNGNIMTQSGTLSNLSVRCLTGGVNSSSGVFTLLDAPSGTAFGSATNTGVTVTFGTGPADTVKYDNTHTFTYAKGDMIFMSISTQASETLATCSASYNY
jgi:hypothetical protein